MGDSGCVAGRSSCWCRYSRCPLPQRGHGAAATSGPGCGPPLSWHCTDQTGQHGGQAAAPRKALRPGDYSDREFCQRADADRALRSPKRRPAAHFLRPRRVQLCGQFRVPDVGSRHHKCSWVRHPERPRDAGLSPQSILALCQSLLIRGERRGRPPGRLNCLRKLLRISCR